MSKIARIGDRVFVSMLHEELGLLWIMPGSTGPVRSNTGNVKKHGLINYVKTDRLNLWAKQRGKYLKIETILDN